MRASRVRWAAPRAALVGLALLAATSGALMGTVPASAGEGADYPPQDAGYHSYAEMRDEMQALAAEYPAIVRVFSIGESAQGRQLWAAEVSDHVGEDEPDPEPEVLIDGLHHAREHLSVEMPLYVLRLLARRYGEQTELGQRVTRLVDSRRIWIVPMVNPDGLAFDLSGGQFGDGHYRGWRKNRQPTPGSDKVGTDLNRNFGYRWGCCGGSSGLPGSDLFRGPRRWSAPETRALRDLVLSRVVDGRQRIRAAISFHTYGEKVLWPFGWTARDVPPDMTSLDQRAMVALARAMASRNGYRAQQSSDMYIHDGISIDWLYARQRIFAFTFELYPPPGPGMDRFYPPDEIIGRETRRNRGAVLHLLERAGCPYGALGAEAGKAWCGPLFDDLEVERGWVVDAGGTDTATGGAWTRADPEADRWQLGSAADGRAALVTGAAADRDVDGGTTTVRSPLVRLPSGPSTLRLRWWVALGPAAGPQDGLRVRLVGADGERLATLLAVVGDGTRHEAAWTRLLAAIPAELAGSRVAVELEAVDAGGDAPVEAGVDQVRITEG